MNILIRGDKLKVTDAIRAHIEEKLGRLNKYFDSSDEIHANVLIKVRDKDQIIEVTIPTKKFTLRAEEKHSDLYAATDLVVDKLERQIRKNKTRLNNRFKKEEVPELVFEIIETTKIIINTFFVITILTYLKYLLNDINLNFLFGGFFNIRYTIYINTYKKTILILQSSTIIIPIIQLI